MKAVKFEQLRLVGAVLITSWQQSDILTPALFLPAKTRLWYHYIVINTKADRAGLSNEAGARIAAAYLGEMQSGSPAPIATRSVAGAASRHACPIGALLAP